MRSIFSFGGVSDLAMGVQVTGVTRAIKPAKRKVQNVIPGRSGTLDYTEDAYSNTQIIMDCMYVGDDPSLFARQVALWLSGTNDLIMADEPDKTYTATVWSDIPEDYVFSLRHFTLTFDCQPFAESLRYRQTQWQFLPAEITPDIQGTQESPFIIRIKADTDITGLTIARKRFN